MEKRREFLLRLGLPRHDAYELSKNKEFDVKRLEQKCYEYFDRGFGRDDAMNRILYELRNQNNGIEDVTHRERGISRKSSPSRIISTFYKEEQDNINFDHRENHSRSRSRPYEPIRKYRPARSSSPNLYSNTLHENVREEYFSRQFNNRDDVERETIHEGHYSPRYTLAETDRRRKYNQQWEPRSINEEKYHQRPYSPPGNDRREERYQPSRSQSPNRGVHEKNQRSYSPLRNHGRKERSPNRVINEQYRQQRYSPLRFDSRAELYHSGNMRSPNGDKNERYRHHPYSPPRNDSREEGHPDGKYIQYDNFGNEIEIDLIRDRSRSVSPFNIDRRQKFYHSSRSPVPIRVLREAKPEEIYDQPRHRDYSPNRKNVVYRSTESSSSSTMFGNTRNIPSLLTLDVFPKETQAAKVNLQNRNIPSLLALQIFPDQIDLKHPSASRKSNFHNQESNKRIKIHDNKNQAKSAHKDRTEIKKSNIDNPQINLRQNIAEVPVIQSGLRKPTPGHLKANPCDYWSQWWPHYKYIEISIPKINPNEYEVKSNLFYLLKPNSSESHKRSHLLLNQAVRTIMKTVDIDETNYYMRDIFKLFQYKKHLEDPNFQNTLSPVQLNCIAPALRQFRIKSTMAFLHQALIVKWHVSLDIMRKVQTGEPVMSVYAKNLLNDKSFHYFVMESIRELKKMCQQDWPQFNEFYKNLKAKKVDIYSLGVGPK